MSQLKKINCGILFNAKENNFSEYLLWLNDYALENKNLNLKVFTNDISFVKSEFLIEDSRLASSFNEILNFSDLLISLGFWKIIKKENIEKVPLGIVNFHHSYKLKYRGRHCSSWVLKNNESFHGSTMHYLDENLDQGKIIDSRSFKINNSDVAEDLFQKANNIGLQMLKENFSSLIRRKIDKKIDLSENQYLYKKNDLSHEISSRFVNHENDFLREIRSLTFSGKPSPYIKLDNKKIYLKLEDYDSGILGKTNDAI